MKRLAAFVLACLITISGVTLAQHFLPSGAVHAQEVRSSSTPLESTFVQQDSQGVNVLGPNHEGHYRGQTIDSGVQLLGCSNPIVAEFHLGGQYDRLNIILSNEATGGTATITINDKSNPATPRLLFRTDVVALGQVRTRVGVSGIQFLTVEMPPACAVDIDVQGMLSKGPPAMTQVVPRYPTGNAGVPAESKVLFAWKPFPHATNYAIHIWLVGLNGATTLTATTPFSFAASIYHKTSYTWDDHGFLPGTYQYSLLPLDDQSHNLAGWSAPTQFTIASS